MIDHPVTAGIAHWAEQYATVPPRIHITDLCGPSFRIHTWWSDQEFGVDNRSFGIPFMDKSFISPSMYHYFAVICHHNRPWGFTNSREKYGRRGTAMKSAQPTCEENVSKECRGIPSISQAVWGPELGYMSAAATRGIRILFMSPLWYLFHPRPFSCSFHAAFGVFWSLMLGSPRMRIVSCCGTTWDTSRLSTESDGDKGCLVAFLVASRYSSQLSVVNSHWIAGIDSWVFHHLFGFRFSVDIAVFMLVHG